MLGVNPRKLKEEADVRRNRAQQSARVALDASGSSRLAGWNPEDASTPSNGKLPSSQLRGRKARRPGAPPPPERHAPPPPKPSGRARSHQASIGADRNYRSSNEKHESSPRHAVSSSPYQARHSQSSHSKNSPKTRVRHSGRGKASTGTGGRRFLDEETPSARERALKAVERRRGGAIEAMGAFGGGREVPYKRKLLLRAARGEILQLRDRLQRFVHSRYKDLRVLMQRLDTDLDGLISRKDWIEGTKRYSFPLTKDEAELIFAAIDEDGNDGLDYRELLRVFQPASLTSAPRPGDKDEARAREDLEGFKVFSEAQVRAIEDLGQFSPRGTFQGNTEDPLLQQLRDAVKVKADMGAIGEATVGGDGKPPRVDKEGKVDLGRDEDDQARVYHPQMRRHASNRDEEVKWVRQKVARQVGTHGAEFFRQFARFDVHDQGWITEQQALAMCGPQGFDFGLSRREQRLLLEELSEGGAVEPNSFEHWIRDQDDSKTTGQILQESKDRAFRSLQRRIEEEPQRHRRALEEAGPPPEDRTLPASLRVTKASTWHPARVVGAKHGGGEGSWEGEAKGDAPGNSSSDDDDDAWRVGRSLRRRARLAGSLQLGGDGQGELLPNDEVEGDAGLVGLDGGSTGVAARRRAARRAARRILRATATAAGQGSTRMPRSLKPLVEEQQPSGPGIGIERRPPVHPLLATVASGPRAQRRLQNTVTVGRPTPAVRGLPQSPREQGGEQGDSDSDEEGRERNGAYGGATLVPLTTTTTHARGKGKRGRRSSVADRIDEAKARQRRSSMEPTAPNPSAAAAGEYGEHDAGEEQNAHRGGRGVDGTQGGRGSVASSRSSWSQGSASMRGAAHREGDVPFRVRGGHLVVSGGAGGGDFKAATGIKSRRKPAVERMRLQEAKRDMFSLEVPETMGGGTMGSAWGDGEQDGGGMGTLRRSFGSTTSLHRGQNTASRKTRLALSGRHSGLGGGSGLGRHSASQPLLGLRPTMRAVPGPGGLGTVAIENGAVGAYMQQARQKQRTQRTLLRPPPSTTGPNTVIPPQSSAAASTEADRFVRKGRLMPGDWERSVAGIGASIGAGTSSGSGGEAHGTQRGHDLLRLSRAEPTIGGEIVGRSTGGEGEEERGGGGDQGAGAGAGTRQQRRRGLHRTFDASRHATGPARTVEQERRQRRAQGGSSGAAERIQATYRRENLLQEEKSMAHSMARGKHSLLYQTRLREQQGARWAHL